MMKSFILSLCLFLFCFTIQAQVPYKSKDPIILAPPIPPSAPVFSNIEGSTITFSWTNGNLGANRIVVARAGAAPEFVPQNDIAYPANASFGSGADVSGVGRGEYVVYNNNGNTVTITNLQHSTTYYFEVIEYNVFAPFITYTTDFTLETNQSTLFPPTAASTGGVASQPSSTSMILSWTRGAGTGTNRLVVLKEGSAVANNPTNYISYAAMANPAFTTPSSEWAGGSQEHLVYAGSGNSITITGLTTGQTYHYKIFEFNGTTGPVYNPAATLSGSVPITTLPLTWISFTGKKILAGAALKWTTAAEDNTLYFVIERSTNGWDYKVVGTIAAQGRGANEYNYVDATAQGAVYYRIKQIDRDGKFDYSKVVLIETTIKSKVEVFPTIVKDKITIRIQKGAYVNLYINNGSLRMSKYLSAPDMMDLSNLSAGTYVIELIEDARTIYRSKLVKQ